MTTRVCFFVGTHGDWGGASRILFNIVRTLDRRRFEPIVVLSQPGPARVELARRGVEHHVRNKHDFDGALHFVYDVLGSVLFLRKHRVDIVHLHHGCIGWRPAELAAARLLRIPIVQHLQQPVRTPSPDLLAATLALTCSNYLATICATGSVPKRVVLDLVDEERFARRRSIRLELGLEPKHIVFAFLGRARRSKGLQMFVDLARQIEHPDARFVIASQRVGQKMDDGYTIDEIDAMVASDQRIRAIGFREDAENVFASSDVIVVPSQIDEPCPAVLIEAAICAKPVIATRVGSTPEFVDDGVTGYLVERSDLLTMAQHARTLLIDHGLRETMGLAACRMAKQRFIAQPLEDIQTIYANLSRP